VFVDSYGTSSKSDEELVQIIRNNVNPEVSAPRQDACPCRADMLAPRSPNT